jgi:hypothetical protein
MKKAILAIAAAATIAAGTLISPTPADARCRGCGFGLLGLGAGLIAGAAIASQPRYYYGPEPGYVVYRGYAEPYPTDCPDGYWARRPMHDRWGNVIGWTQPRFVCP